MTEESTAGELAVETPGEKTGKKAAPRRKKAAGKTAAKKKTAGKAAPKKKAAKKKVARKKAPAGKKAKRKKAAKKKAPAGEKVSIESAPTILVVGAGRQAEQIWLKYSQMTPAEPSKRPSVKTDVRVGNLVSWRTDAGKERIGIVQHFRGDSAAVGIAGRTELIRVVRLTVVAKKVGKK